MGIRYGVVSFGASSNNNHIIGQGGHPSHYLSATGLSIGRWIDNRLCPGCNGSGIGFTSFLSFASGRVEIVKVWAIFTLLTGSQRKEHAGSLSGHLASTSFELLAFTLRLSLSFHEGKCCRITLDTIVINIVTTIKSAIGGVVLLKYISTEFISVRFCSGSCCSLCLLRRLLLCCC